MKNTGRSRAAARWITVMGTAVIGVAIWTAVARSPSATQSAAPANATAPTANFSASDNFLTQPSAASVQSVSAPSTARLRTRGS